MVKNMDILKKSGINSRSGRSARRKKGMTAILFPVLLLGRH